MSPRSVVVRSINLPGDSRCVDVFARPDGSYGFEEYRRDPEDGRGWYPVGSFAAVTYPSQNAALEAAAALIPWLADNLPPLQTGGSMRPDEPAPATAHAHAEQTP
jgi:hypothetical protein